MRVGLRAVGTNSIIQGHEMGKGNGKASCRILLAPERVSRWVERTAILISMKYSYVP